MQNIIDIHTHRQPPYLSGLVNALSGNFQYIPEQFYSIGVHPWENDKFDILFPKIQSLASDPRILAIGETGIDLLRGGAMFQQLLNFKAHLELSEKVGKPLIIHSVKADDVILGVHRDLRPKQPWVIHGFRGKPSVAQMYNRVGIYLSYGEKFNPDSLKITNPELLLAETDESQLSITEIIANLSATLSPQSSQISQISQISQSLASSIIDITPSIQANTRRFLNSIHNS